jgi:hypothetical protein|tara:strand:+ start:582 stop:1019 length:438 start_codon:yes stop_codon:yes gene_type:complete
MASKFLNVLINSVVTPVNIEDVVAVAATGQNGNVAATVAITYKSGKIATLSTPADNDGFNVANAPSVQRAFWSAITKALELPWNMVSYPAPGESFIVEVEPASSQASSYTSQASGGGAATLEAKSSSVVLAKDGGQIVFASIAIS